MMGRPAPKLNKQGVRQLDNSGPSGLSARALDELSRPGNAAAEARRELERRGPFESLTAEDFKADRSKLLRFFRYGHLPAALAAVSRVFADAAAVIYKNIPENAERTAALRKLLESKDCAVRACIPEDL